MFDENLSWMKDTGVIQKMEADAVRDSRAKNDKLSKIAGDRPLTFWKYDESRIIQQYSATKVTYKESIHSLSPGFAMWSVGFLLSVVIFLYEKVMWTNQIKSQ